MYTMNNLIKLKNNIESKIQNTNESNYKRELQNQLTLVAKVLSELDLIIKEFKG